MTFTTHDLSQPLILASGFNLYPQGARYPSSAWLFSTSTAAVTCFRDCQVVNIPQLMFAIHRICKSFLWSYGTCSHFSTPCMPPVTVSVYVSMCMPWDDVRRLFSSFLSNCRSPTRLDMPRSHRWHENLFMRQRYQKILSNMFKSFSEFFRIQHSKSFVQNYLIRNFYRKEPKDTVKTNCFCSSKYFMRKILFALK